MTKANHRIRGSSRLTALKVAKAKGPALLTDGDGLQLIVKGTGRKIWTCRVTVAGKRINRGLGNFPEVSLDAARSKARILRQAAREGRDLTAESKREIARRTVTFRDAFNRYFEEVKRPSLKPGRFAELWPQSMERYVYPCIGSRPVADIAPAEIINLLQPLWHAKRETAARLLQRMSVVFKSAIIRGDRMLANPCDGVAAELGRARSKVKHRRALPWQGVPAFVHDLNEHPRITEASRLALLYIIFTACRSEEVRGARWAEIDFGTSEWTVPGPRMKMKIAHIVPLSTGALDVLARARQLRQPDCDLLRFLLDVNRYGHGGFHWSCKSDSGSPSTAAERHHGQGLLEGPARAGCCDGRGG